MSAQMTLIQDAGKTTAVFTGDLSVRSASELYELFKQIEQVEANILLDHPSAVDLCFWQLVVARNRSGRKSNIEANLSEADQQLLTRTGLKLLINP